jgi:hypothetical protein
LSNGLFFWFRVSDSNNMKTNSMWRRL